jgi:hypothetical protein
MFRDRNDNIRWGVVIPVVLVALLLLGFLIEATAFGYILYGVDSNEIAVQLQSGQIKDIVGPGVYMDLNPFADIQVIKVEGVAFTAYDPEVLTKDQQRIGGVVQGTVFRPGLAESPQILTNWALYKTYYTDDKALVGKVEYKDGKWVMESAGLMQTGALQAMKVCVGDRTFAEAVVGTARDLLGTCIDDQLSEFVQQYGGIQVQNITVPNVELTPKVQELMDAITQSKFETDLASQNKLKAQKEAERTLAERQGAIMVEQGEIQEKTRQETITAALEQQRLAAQKAVIEAQKSNELLTVQKDLEIADAQLKVDQTKAQSALAEKIAFALMLQNNPVYADYLVQQYWAAAWGNSSKFVIPAGTDPTTVLNPDDTAMPPVVVPTNP